MKLIELEQEVYDPAFSSYFGHMHARFAYRDDKELARILQYPEIDRSELTSLLIGESYRVANSSTPDYCIVWKNWTEMSLPPVDIVKIAGIERKLVPWHFYDKAFGEVIKSLRIGKRRFSNQQNEEWPFSGWQKYIQRSREFPGISLLVAHEHYGILTGGMSKTAGGNYFPFRSVAVVTNYQKPLETPLV